MDKDVQDILRSLLSLVGRYVLPANKVWRVVAPNKESGKMVKAFNMCDGTRTQSEIAKTLRIDRGNFSRTVTRWIQAGVLFRIGDNNDARLLHVYPIPEKEPQSDER